MTNNSFYYEFLEDFDRLIRTTPGYKTLSDEFDRIEHFEAISENIGLIVDTIELAVSKAIVRLRFNITFTHKRYCEHVSCRFEAYIDDRLLIKVAGDQDILEGLKHIGNLIMFADVGRE